MNSRCAADREKLSSTENCPPQGGVEHPEMMSLSDFDFRDVKFSPIRARGDARDPFEQPAKKRRVFVTHIPADLIHRRMRSFEPPLRLFHAQSLNVIDGRVAGGA